ncbi:hypothetical protein LTR42_001058 [Elasticomyces elasticus]|nr:hypothetical protein LTR42_001058 [Elasticomyces elasticus]
MYGYYNHAQICFAHLADLHAAEVDRDSLPPEVERMMQGSVWFTGGWTLQEMIAPKRILFCDDDWRFFAHKCRNIWMRGEYKHDCNELPTSCHVNEVVGKITGVTLRVVNGVHYARHDRRQVLFQKPTALEIFGWASRRTTSRVEDMSYCLLGLLGINMPLLYGEGLLAFRRLQEQIIFNTSDDSFFAFHSVESYRTAARIRAKSLRDFVCVSYWDPPSSAILSYLESNDNRDSGTKIINNGTLQLHTWALRLHGPKGTWRKYWLVPVSVFVQAWDGKHADRIQFAVVLETSDVGSWYYRVSDARLPNNIYKCAVNIGESFYTGSKWHICRWRQAWEFLKAVPTWTARKQSFIIELTPQDWNPLA